MSKVTKNEIIEFLQDVYLFSDLSNEDLSIIAENTTQVHYEPGEFIFYENDKAEKFYILMEGEIVFQKKSSQGDINVLARETAGHIFGEMSLVDDLPRSASVKAVTPITVLYIDQQEFLSLMYDRLPILHKVMKSLTSMVRKSNESYVDDLSERNRELEATNIQLKQAQDDLIRAERFSNLGKIVSVVVHDLRNPISIIRGYAEMMSLVQDDPKRMQDYSRKIVNEADRLNTFASELLDYSRGKIRLQISPVRVGILFERLYAQYEHRLSAKNIRFIVKGDQNVMVVLDIERMVRALGNLIDNAQKAILTNEGMIMLSTGLFISKNGSEIFRISVTDSGIGIPEDKLTKVFEPFYSASENGGTGLGMVSVKNIAEAHGGKIHIQSQVNKGTTVHLLLPRSIETVAQNSD